MDIRKTLFALTVSTLFAAPVHAQDAEALAEEYVNMPEVQQMMSEMFSPASMAAQFEAGLPPNVQVTGEQRERIGALLSETMNAIKPRMEELMVEGSARHFTPGELQALIDFYGSEHGASVMAKMQPFFQEIMARLQPEMQQQMQAVTPQIVQIMQGG